jgi:DNA/RNA-binding domain of Phe-tRNA-synthetase-like protein
MGNQSHTPGPWRVEWIRNSVYIKADHTDRNISICRVMTHRNSNNTSLLVHAPDMLDVLERLMNTSSEEDFDAAYSDAERLIQKITGETNA